MDERSGSHFSHAQTDIDIKLDLKILSFICGKENPNTIFLSGLRNRLKIVTTIYLFFLLPSNYTY